MTATGRQQTSTSTCSAPGLSSSTMASWATPLSPAAYTVGVCEAAGDCQFDDLNLDSLNWGLGPRPPDAFASAHGMCLLHLQDLFHTKHRSPKATNRVRDLKGCRSIQFIGGFGTSMLEQVSMTADGDQGPTTHRVSICRQSARNPYPACHCQLLGLFEVFQADCRL